MKGYGIFRLNMNLRYELVLTYSSSDSAIKQLNRMAKKYQWKFVADQSLFGGYWVAATGVCYSVYGHNPNLAVA